MKLVKIFGIVMAAHGVAFMFIFAIPGCRSTPKKPVAAAPVIGAESSPLIASTPEAAPEVYTAPETPPVRFSPTRPGTPAATEVAAPAAASTHTVVKGDSLWSIARKHGITVKELTTANKLRADATLKLDQKLIIPGKAAPATAPSAVSSAASTERVAPSVAATAGVTHVIKPGETLGGIAKKYQVKVGDIATANNIADPTKIRAGQSLKIPGAPASATARSAAPATPAARPAPVPAAPALAPAAPLPLAPVFDSPVSPAPAPVPALPTTEESPFVTPASETSDAPMIRVEESGAPRIE